MMSLSNDVLLKVAACLDLAAEALLASCSRELRRVLKAELLRPLCLVVSHLRPEITPNELPAHSRVALAVQYAYGKWLPGS